MNKVLYPGSFDPLTIGHMSIIEEGTDIFDEVIIAILTNPLKNNFYFSKDERFKILNKIYENNPKIKIIVSDKPVVDVTLECKCNKILRGIRNYKDFEYEKDLALINKDISKNKIHTVSLFAEPKFQFISSSMVKEILNLNKDISQYVHPLVKEKMLEKKGSL